MARQTSEAPLHVIDLIRKKRDGETLDGRELAFLAQGAADESIPIEQLAAACVGQGFEHDIHGYNMQPFSCLSRGTKTGAKCRAGSGMSGALSRGSYMQLAM